MKQDGRRDQRQPIALRVRFKSATLSDFIEKHSGDVSRGGIFIKTKKPMPVGTLLKFEFLLKSDESLINGVGRVVWTRLTESKDKEPPGMGIKFIKLDDENKGRLEEIVAGQARSSDFNIDEPFDVTEGAFPPSILPPTTSDYDTPENIDDLDLDATGEHEVKPPIAVPRAVAPPPKQRGPSVSVPSGAKGTMLGYVPIGDPPSDRGGDLTGSDLPLPADHQTPDDAVDVEAANSSDDATRPVPTSPPARGIILPDEREDEEESGDQSLIETRENEINLEMIRSAENKEPEGDEPESSESESDESEQTSQGGFSAEDGGVRESGILKDISLAIDTALSRKTAAALKEASASASSEPQSPTVSEVHEAESEAAEGSVDAAFDEPQPTEKSDLPETVEDDEDAIGETLSDDDVKPHEAVVLADTPARGSVPPGKPAVEATRAGAEATGSSGIPVPIILLLLLLILGGGGAGWWFMFGPGKKADTQTSQPQAVPKKTAPVNPSVQPAPVEPAAATADKKPGVMSSVEIVSEPEGAAVYLAGELLKKTTPLVLSDLESGQEIEVRVSAFGFVPILQKVMVEPEPKKVELKMVNAERLVVLKGSPAGATVFANGKILGKLGNTVSLERVGPGFSYLVRKTGFEPKRGTIRRGNWAESDGVWQTEISVRLIPATSAKIAPAPGSAPVVKPAPKSATKPEPKPKPELKPKPKPEPKPKPKPAPPKKKASKNIDENPF